MLLGKENSFLMEPLDQREHVQSNNDIMSRRLKNRERQRRYRARKRLEADMKNANTTNNSTPLQVEVQVSGIPDNYVMRIHCQRDWKKDSRMAAHAAKKQKVISNCAAIAGLTSANESQSTLFPSGAEAMPPIESEFHSTLNSHEQNNIERSVTPARRHWKADARKRKAEV
ncbi:hypothetical protein ACSBR2_037527 [Camellia fascicularis]